MPYARTDDRVKFYYELHGEGAPLVLAYGSGGNPGMWDVNVRALVVEHRVVLWEPQGHAPSDSRGSGQVLVRRWVLDLTTVMDHLGLCAPGRGGTGVEGLRTQVPSTGPLFRLCSDPVVTTTEVQR